jgi:hypothetical protein
MPQLGGEIGQWILQMKSLAALGRAVKGYKWPLMGY